MPSGSEIETILQEAVDVELRERPMRWGFFTPLRRDWAFWTAFAVSLFGTYRWAAAADIAWMSVQAVFALVFMTAYSMFGTCILISVTLGVVRGFREGARATKRSALATRVDAARASAPVVDVPG
jgi:hypothetical protein